MRDRASYKEARETGRVPYIPTHDVLRALVYVDLKDEKPAISIPDKFDELDLKWYLLNDGSAPKTDWWDGAELDVSEWREREMERPKRPFTSHVDAVKALRLMKVALGNRRDPSGGPKTRPHSKTTRPCVKKTRPRLKNTQLHIENTRPGPKRVNRPTKPSCAKSRS